MEPMRYAYVAIPDERIPRASDPAFQHMLDTYVSETNKVVSVWREFRDSDLAYRPHPRSTTVGDIFKHQLLSERRFFGEFIGAHEPAPAEVLPAEMSVAHATERLVQLATARLDFLAQQRAEWWLARVPFFEVERERILDLLAARAAHCAPSHAAHCVSADDGSPSAADVRSDGGRAVGWRGPDEQRERGGKKVAREQLRLRALFPVRLRNDYSFLFAINRSANSSRVSSSAMRLSSDSTSVRSGCASGCGADGTCGCCAHSGLRALPHGPQPYGAYPIGPPITQRRRMPRRCILNRKKSATTSQKIGWNLNIGPSGLRQVELLGVGLDGAGLNASSMSAAALRRISAARASAGSSGPRRHARLKVTAARCANA